MDNTVKHQSGLTLIEILVTVIILSIGFLGLASVQLMGTKNVANSQYRTMATIYAYDMAERMRANLAGVTSSAYDDVDTASATEPECSPCNTVQQARLDAFQWKGLIEAAQIDGGLPNGSGVVEYNSDDDVYEITVSWSELERFQEPSKDEESEGYGAEEDNDGVHSLLLSVRL